MLCALLLLCSAGFAQSLNKITIKGTVKDTLGEVAPFATVMLLTPQDSQLINFTRSDENGDFSFKNVKNNPYLVKVSYIGFLPLQKYIGASTTEINDVGTLILKPISKELLEVVIKAARSTLSIKGDTIEYDAASFKVPPGSTVEDMLRRLPGIEVDADGNIKAQGRDVKRVYVDGKMFFSDDPKAATKNLGAETISKIQVYNDKSEQSKLTGVDDGKKEKAMNLELKEEYKKGSFGKITGAVGTEERWAGRGNYNRFNTKEQISVIGYANNINQTGLNWEDYGEFKGQNTFNNDDADFGFSGGGGRMYFMGGDDSDIPFSNFDGRGFSENYGGGANYNFDNKKSKFNTSYFYNQTELQLDQIANRLGISKENSFSNTDTTSKLDFRANHSISSRLEHEIDSSDIIILKLSTRFSNGENTNLQNQLFSNADNSPVNSLNINNRTDLQNWRLVGSGIYRHRFKKKGRSFAVSGGYSNINSDGTDNVFSLNRFFNATTINEQISQLNSNENYSQEIKSSALYTESFKKRWFSETFYNFSKGTNAVNRQVKDLQNNGERINDLSVYYDNAIMYNRLGSSMRYSHEGINVSTGLAAQQIQLFGASFSEKGKIPLSNPIDNTYFNIVPNIDINYETSSNITLSGEYSYGVSIPRLNDLQPVQNVSNPAFITLGNPDLKPERSHNLGANVNYWNQSSFSSFNLGMDLDFFDQQIVYNQILSFDSLIRTTTIPVNASGGKRFNTYIWTNFPLIKTKLTMNCNISLNISETPAFVNNDLNNTNNKGYRVSLGWNATPSPKLIFGAGVNANFNDIKYSINEDLDQHIENYGANASIKWQFFSKFFLESNVNYSLYKNDRFGFDREFTILNGSVRRLFGKNNRIEARLAAFDLLNQRVTVSQYGSQNFITNNVANTLARYFMLSVSYNMRGYENKIKKNDWW